MESDLADKLVQAFEEAIKDTNCNIIKHVAIQPLEVWRNQDTAEKFRMFLKLRFDEVLENA